MELFRTSPVAYDIKLYQRVDGVMMALKLSRKISPIYLGLRSAQHINEKVDVWLRFLKSCMDKHFPLRMKRIRNNTHPWLDNSVKVDAETKSHTQTCSGNW